jgi:hypothetical protein
LQERMAGGNSVWLGHRKSAGLLLWSCRENPTRIGPRIKNQNPAVKIGRQRSAFGPMCTRKFLKFTPKSLCVDPFDLGKQSEGCHNRVREFAL